MLYYKDCQRTAKEQTTPVPEPARYAEPPPPPPPRQPDCPFPKMCCALSCGNECGGSQPSFISRQMESMPGLQSMQPMQPLPQARPPDRMGAVQPTIVQRRKKKLKFQPNKMQAPILTGPTRRDGGGFTKEKIKSLISQDDDIRKILKDLVRVTMQKVDLLDMMGPKVPADNGLTEPPTPKIPFEDYEE